MAFLVLVILLQFVPGDALDSLQHWQRLALQRRTLAARDSLQPEHSAAKPTASASFLTHSSSKAHNGRADPEPEEEEKAKEQQQTSQIKPWHQDVRFLARILMLLLPCLVISVILFEWRHRYWADADFSSALPEVTSADSRTEFSGLLRGFGTLTSPYFCNPAGFKGRVYAVVVLLLGLVGLFLALVQNAWSKEFWDTFKDKNLDHFFYLLCVFLMLATIFVLNDVYSQYIRQMLYIHWRGFMTETYLRKWLGHQAYFTMQLGKGGEDATKGRQGENPEQRLQEDIHLFVNDTINIVYQCLSSFGHFMVFLPLLLMLSPSKAFGFFYCPGWLVYLALLYSIFGTFATHVVGSRLIPIGFAQQQYEADFRFGLTRIRDNAQSIALYRGEESEERLAAQRFERIKLTWWQNMMISKRVAYFVRGFSLLQTIIPFFILAPSYFKGDISMGSLFQLTHALGTVWNSFDLVVNTYGLLTHWRATADRLLSFDRAVDEAQSVLAASKMERHLGPSPPGAADVAVAARNLAVQLPDGLPLWKNFSLSIKRGECVLITGREGLGKSVLFQTIAGTWPFVERGEVWLAPTSNCTEESAASRVLFVPQRCYFPTFCSLRGALAYPNAPNRYSDAELLSALRAVKLEVILDRDDASEKQEFAATSKSLASDGDTKSENCEEIVADKVVCNKSIAGLLQEGLGDNAAADMKGHGLDMEAKWGLMLSPGQQQRLAIARVLLHQPLLLFLDEATSSVGQDSSKELYRLVRASLPKGATVVSISHEVDLLAPLHDRTVVLTS